MRFRFCCTCDDEEKSKNVENKQNSPEAREPTNSVLPKTRTTTKQDTVITQQPKHVLEPSQPTIQLDRITEVSVEESSIQTTEEEQPSIENCIREPLPVTAQRPVEINEDIINTLSEKKEDSSIAKSQSEEADELCNKLLKILQADRDKEKYNNPPPAPQSYPSSTNQASSFSVDTTIADEKLNFYKIGPDLYQGTFKGSQFHIINGKIHDAYFAFGEEDKAAIQMVYDRVIESMQRGIEHMTGGVSALNGQGQDVWHASAPSGSTINTNYVTRSGENAKMTFKVISKSHFRSIYEGKEFSILNGQLLAPDGSFDEEDKKLIMQTFQNTLIGMEQGLLGMQRGMPGMRKVMQDKEWNAIGSGSAFAGTKVQGGTAVSSVAVGGNATAYASTGIGGSAYASAVGGVAIANAGTLANGRETIRRMNHGKRISLLEGGLIAQPRQPLMVIEDITDEKSKKPQHFDSVDGGKLAEPVLQKTTFTPQAIIYEDPKTYEEQDKNELPLAKNLDEYIISRDENFNSENRYHFHKARPRRVIRKNIEPKEKFRLASPERFSLFESECLKFHNQYRKKHGVPPLVHNEFLSQVAKEWAEHLALKDAFYHRPNNEYGENLYYVERMSCHAKMAVKSWYDEIDLYDYDNPKFSREVGHFTQLVWKDTREIGTGVAQIGDKVWVCCNYHPQGNYLDKLNDEFVPRPLMKRVKNN